MAIEREVELKNEHEFQKIFGLSLYCFSGSSTKTA